MSVCTSFHDSSVEPLPKQPLNPENSNVNEEHQEEKRIMADSQVSGNISPNRGESSIRKRAGFILSKRRSVTEMDEEFNQQNNEPKGLNLNINTQFNPSRKPPIPKIKKIRTKLHSISIENRKLAERFENTTISDLPKD